MSPREETHTTLEKPKFGSPCNHCGICCRLSLCPAAALFLGPGVKAPCPAITEIDGKFLCGLVLQEIENATGTTVRDILGVGNGCTMQDQDTTDAEIAALDWKSLNEAIATHELETQTNQTVREMPVA